MKLIISFLAMISFIMTLLVNAAMALDPAAVALKPRTDSPHHLGAGR